MEYVSGMGNHITEKNIENHTNIFITSDKETFDVNNWRDKLVAFLQNLPARTDHLKPIIQLLIAAFSPAKIYLLDHKNIGGKIKYTGLLMVLPASYNSDIKDEDMIMDLLISDTFEISCSLHKEINVLEGLRSGHPFYSTYCKPENMIYDNGKKIYPITPEDTLQEINVKAKATLQLFLNRANDFYKAANHLQEGHNTNLVIFLLHQAIELTFRGIINGLIGADKQTHNLRSLRKYSKRCTPNLCQVISERTNVDKELMDLLDDAYIGARYKENYSFKIEAVPLLFIKVGLFLDTAGKMVEIQQLPNTGNDSTIPS